MSREKRALPVWLIGTIIGAFAAMVAMGPQTLEPALWIIGSALAWTAWRAWRAHQASHSVLAALGAHWATLSGAQTREHVVHVHHGDQPLWVHLSHSKARGMGVRISTRIGELPLAFRIWPKGQKSPGLTPEGGSQSRADLKRSAILESWFVGQFEVESNDEERLTMLVGRDVVASVLTLSNALGSDLEGLVYDGQSLTIAFHGSIAADPERSLQLAKIGWRNFVP